VSVVIPTIGEETLINVLESLLNSTIKPIEIILSVHEDHYNLIRTLESDIVKILKNNTRGQVMQRINGFKETKGDYILQIDSDIILEIDSIELLLNSIDEIGDNVAIAPVLKSNKLFNNNNNLFYILFKKVLALILDGKTNLQPGIITKSSIESKPPNNDLKLTNIQTEWIPGGCVLHRKQNLILNNYYNYSGKAICEDLFHSFYLSKKNIKLYINKDVIVQHIDNSNEDFHSLDDLKRHLNKLYKIRKEFLYLVQGNAFRFHIWFSYFIFKQTLSYLLNNKDVSK
jgi:glycosyltransferase involved in cell wall biosynthesis